MNQQTALCWFHPAFDVIDMMTQECITLMAFLTFSVLQVNIVSCDGKCPSASIYNYNINTYARFCKCCRETGLQRRSVQLYCSSNATWVTYSIQEPTDCSCQWS